MRTPRPPTKSTWRYRKNSREMGLLMFRCASCKNEFNVHPAAIGRHTRPRCPGCGSYAIDPFKSSGEAAGIRIAQAMGRNRRKF